METRRERDEHSDKINPSRVYCHMKHQMFCIKNWLQYGKIICTLIKLHWSVKMWFYSVTWGQKFPLRLYTKNVLIENAVK